MSVHEPPHSAYRPAPGFGMRRLPSWRWLAELVWRLEHAFERAKASNRPEEDTRVRIFVIMAVFAVVFGCLALRASWSAVFAPSAVAGSAASPHGLARADLVDRDGRLLAANITHYGLYIDPAEVWDRRSAFDQIRRALPRVSDRKLRRVLWGERRLVVLNGLTPAERRAVHALALGGVSFEPEDKRVYPLGGSGAHVIGRTDNTGSKGLSGAEKQFDAEIREAGARGAAYPISIDLRVQGVLENELARAAEEAGAKGAAGIVADVQTGEVLGMASWPADQSLNRAAAAHYEMGSVFKSITVAAGIDTGQADMNTLFDASQALVIGNRRIKDFHAQNRIMTLEEVYIHSSNIGTSQLALDLGPERMRDYFTRFGLLDRWALAATPRRPREWSNTTLASLSFGYGIMVTPAHMAQAMGAMVNGGRLIPLTLRRGGDPKAQPRQVISEETSVAMLDLMRRNVVRGSGTRADAPGLRVGGKTGSANKLVGGRYDASHAIGTFAGVFPTDGPLNARRYSVLILIDEPSSYPKTGGFVAAPAVGRIADRIAPFVGVERRGDRWATADGQKIPQADDPLKATQ